jgi:hypothetical protein
MVSALGQDPIDRHQDIHCEGEVMFRSILVTIILALLLAIVADARNHLGDDRLHAQAAFSPGRSFSGDCVLASGPTSPQAGLETKREQ